MNREIQSLYALIFADVHQCGQIISNSLLHDRRLLDYFAAAPASLPHDHHALGLLLDELVRLLREDALVPTADVVDGLLKRQDTLSFGDFVALRSSVGAVMRNGLVMGGTIHQQLRSQADASAPDLTVPWSRLQTADHSEMESVSRLARCCSRRLTQWYSSAVGDTPMATDLRLAIDFGFLSYVHERHRLLPHAEVRLPSEIHLFLSLPFWLLSMQRYAPVVAHEVAHPFARLVLKHEKDVQVLAEDAMDIIGRFLKVHTGERDIPTRPYAQMLLEECLCDGLALELLGSSYLVALALFSLGRTALRDPEATALTVPLAVRLRMLAALLDEAHPRLPRLEAAISAQEEHYRAITRQSQGAYVAFQEDIFPLVRGFVREVLDQMGPIPNCPDGTVAAAAVGAIGGQSGDIVGGSPRQVGQACADCGGPVLLWQTIEDNWSSEPDLIPWLNDLPEGARLLEHGFRRRCSRSVSMQVEFGEPWSLTNAFVRVRRGRVLADPDLAPESQLARARRMLGPRAGECGYLGVVLGPCDLISLRRGYRSRRHDGVDPTAYPGDVYLKRRSLLEIKRLVSNGREVFSCSRREDEVPNLLTEIRIGERHSVDSFLAELLALVEAPNCGDESLVPLRIFLGKGWNQLVLLWRFSHARLLTEVHRRLLARREDCQVERSVSHLLTYVETGGRQNAVPAWDPDEVWPDGHRVIANLRTFDASCIPALKSFFDQSSTSLEMELGTLLGLHDAVARIQLRHGKDLLDTTRLLLRAIGHHITTRSFCHLAFPPEAETPSREAFKTP